MGNSQNIELQKVGLSELQELKKVDQVTFREAFGDQNTAEDMEKYLLEKFSDGQITSEIKHPESVFYLAKFSGETVEKRRTFG